MTKQDILGIGISVVVTTIVWLSGYVTGLCVGKASKKDYGFEKATNQAIETAKETLEIAKKLQKENDQLKEENDSRKEQLNQNER